MILIKTLTLSWWLANFTPLQNTLRKYIKPHIPLSLSYISIAMSCFMCISFWTTLLWTFDIFYATGAAMIAYTYQRIMDSFKQYL